MRRIILTCALAGILTAPAFAQGVDPLVGTWKMNPERSTVVGLPMLKSQTLTWSGEGQNLIDTADAIDSEGQPLHVIFRHIYDGQPHPTTGDPGYDSSTYTRIGNTMNIVRFKEGKTVLVAQAVVVPGKTYTITAEGIAPNGQQYHYVYVYDRQ
jgi:hypothetical protein